jgi:hypothetical protein
MTRTRLSTQLDSREFTSVFAARKAGAGRGVFVRARERVRVGTILATFGPMELHPDQSEALWPPQFKDCMIELLPAMRRTLGMHGAWVAAPAAKSMEELLTAGRLGALVNTALTANECNSRFLQRVVHHTLYVDVVALRDIAACGRRIEVIVDYGRGFRQRIAKEAAERIAAAQARSLRSPAAMPRTTQRGRTPRQCKYCSASHTPSEAYLHRLGRCI